MVCNIYFDTDKSLHTHGESLLFEETYNDVQLDFEIIGSLVILFTYNFTNTFVNYSLGQRLFGPKHEP